MSGLNWKLEDDYKSVTVTFPTNPPVTLKLDAAGVEDILRNLGELRALMKPEIAPQYTMGQKIFAVPDPVWATQPDIMRGDSLLHLRDPRYGWLHYMLPRHEAQKLSESPYAHRALGPGVSPKESGRGSACHIGAG